MDRCLLKNIIIIILVLVNGFLLASLVMRYTASAQVQRQTEEQLAALFAADGMELNEDVLSQDPPPPVLSLSRDQEREQAAAAFLLGSRMTESGEDGDVVTYSSDRGAARFHSNGAFDAAGDLSDGGAEDVCREFCETFSCGAPVLSLDETGSGTASAVCLHGGIPVYNAAVTFTIDQGDLLSVSGTLLPEEAAAGDSQELLSAAAALTAFQQARRESYMVVSAVTDLYPCYELVGSTASALSLVPVWCVVTDTANYYVNCITGVVAAA